MSDLYLVRKNLTRNKLRLVLNTFAILIAFLLFGVLGAIDKVFKAGVEMSSDNRLVTVNKINFTQPMPLAYVNKIRAIEGVESVTWANWFGGYFQDQRQQVISFAVDPESYMQVYPEIIIPEEQLQNWKNTRSGALIGKQLAEIRGWKVGDTIPLSSNIFFKSDGSSTWDLEISGIFTGKDPHVDTSYLMMHYKYFIETQVFGNDWIGWISLTTEDPVLNEQVAKAIDAQFANSSAETKTSTEKQFNKAFIEQFGNIGFILTSVVTAAFFTILMIVGNSMALAVRERTGEIAVLKTLGFNARRIFGQVLSESLLLSFVGGLLGVLLAVVVVGGMAEVPQIRSIFPTLTFTGDIFVQAVLFMIVLGVVTGFIPAYRAMKLKTIDALNRS